MAESNSPAPRCPCGFWGSPQTGGLCSKCYKDKNPQQGSKPDATAVSTGATGITNSSFSKAFAQVAPMPAGDLTADKSANDSGTESSSSITDGSKVAPQPDSEQMDTDTASADSGSNSGADSKGGDNGTKREISDIQEDPDPNRVPQKNKKRCFKCNCKLELAIREIGRCKCDYIFCPLHRLPEQHDCIFDHKETGRKEAREKMVSPKKHIGTSLRRLDSVP